MRNKIICKELVFGIVLMFVGAGVVSALNENLTINYKPMNLGNWLYVGGGGLDNYTRIQEAIDNASSGTIINVWSGIYNENIQIDKSISLIGNGSTNTFITGTGTGDVIYVNSDNVNISGFTISGSGSDVKDAGLKFIIIFNCHVTNNKFTNNEHGIYLDSVSYADISNNEFVNNDYSGIFLDFCSQNEISNNTISSNGDKGIHLASSTTNRFINNVISNNVDDGVYFHYSTHNKFIDNDCKNNNGDGFYLFESSSNKFVGNIFQGNLNGIFLTTHSSGNKIENCSINSNTNVDLVLTGSSKINFAINTSFTTINIWDGSSELAIMNYLHIITKNLYNEPMPGVDIKVLDNYKTIYSTENFSGNKPKTDKNGILKWIAVIDRIYDGNSIPTENRTTVVLKHENKVVIDNDRPVDMATTHYELFYLNSIPTQVTLKHPVDNGYVNVSRPTLNWTPALDTDGDPLRYYVQVDESGDNWGTPIAFTKTNPNIVKWKISEELKDNKKYQWRVCANDGYINGSWSNISNFRVDLDIPKANKPHSNVNQNNTGTVTWYWSPSNNTGSGIVGYYVTITRHSDNRAIVLDAWTPATSYTAKNLQDGETYYCSIVAKNGAGSLSEESMRSEGVVVDTTAPEKPESISVLPVDWTSKNLFTISWTNPLDYSGVKKGAYYIMADNPPASDKGGLWIPDKPFTIINAKEGESNIYFWLEDNAGNSNYKNYGTVSLKLDSKPPSITHTKVVKGTYGVAIEIYATVNDKLTGLDTVRLYYKRDSDSGFSKSSMTLQENVYYSTIPDGFVVSEGVSYYIEAKDKSNPPNIIYYGIDGETEIKPNHETDIDIAVLPTITAHSPKGNDVSVTSSISITFSKQMEREPTEAAFAIFPNIAGVFAWKDNKFTYILNIPFDYNTTYNITIKYSASDRWGNNLEKDFSWEFRTELKPKTQDPIDNKTSDTPDKKKTDDKDNLGDQMWMFGLIGIVIIIIVVLGILFLLKRKKRAEPSSIPSAKEKPTTERTSPSTLQTTTSTTSTTTRPGPLDTGTSYPDYSAQQSPATASTYGQAPGGQPPQTLAYMQPQSQPQMPPPYRCARCGMGIYEHDRCVHCGWVQEPYDVY